MSVLGGERIVQIQQYERKPRLLLILENGIIMFDFLFNTYEAVTPPKSEQAITLSKPD
jgi:cell wall-associated NlpC family hydrolase